MSIFVAYCLFDVHNEHTIKRNFLLDMLSKQAVSPLFTLFTMNHPKKGCDNFEGWEWTKAHDQEGLLKALKRCL